MSKTLHSTIYLLFAISLICGSFGSILIAVPNQEPKTRLVSVLFRHGDRAPDTHNIEKFPRDPYVNNSFFPEGPGGLTNAGKKREYAIGQMLRRKYDSFLGPIYSPSEVFARSTNFERTMMSLELVLAGLYPPHPVQKWEDTLNWQPVVINLRDGEDDGLGPMCPQYYNELVKVANHPDFRKKIERYDDLFPKLTKLSGRDVYSPIDAALLYHALMAEASMGLELPSWTKNIFPNGSLLELALLEYELSNYNDNLRKLNTGRVLKAIIDSALKVLTGASNRKINLFSGHEITVASFLYTLGVFDAPHVPSYSAAVIIELLEDSRDLYVKVLYYRGIPAEIEEKIIPGCTLLCPLEKFIKLLSNVIPTDAEVKCL